MIWISLNNTTKKRLTWQVNTHNVIQMRKGACWLKSESRPSVLPIRHLWYFPNSCLWLFAAGAATVLTWDSISCLQWCSQGQAGRTGYRCTHTHARVHMPSKDKGQVASKGGRRWPAVALRGFLSFFCPLRPKILPWLVTLIQSISHKIQTLFDVKHNPKPTSLLLRPSSC